MQDFNDIKANYGYNVKQKIYLKLFFKIIEYANLLYYNLTQMKGYLFCFWLSGLKFLII